MIYRPRQKTLASPFAVASASDEPPRAPLHPPLPFADAAGSCPPVLAFEGASSYAGASSHEGAESSRESSQESSSAALTRSRSSGASQTDAPPLTPPALPAREPRVGRWVSGAQVGDKAKPSMKLRSLHARHALSSRDPLHKNLPAVFVSALQARSGETYLITQTLARGSQGKFRICSRGDEYFGVKEYRLVPKEGATDSADPASIFSEWETASKHGGMVVHDIIVQDDRKVLVITDLYDRTAQQGMTHVPESQQALYALGVTWHLAKHLEALHAQRVLHRDIKPANVFLGKEGVALGDYGYAEPLGEDGTVTQVGGTPGFMTPEMLFAQPHGPSADMWGLAMTWCALHDLPTPFNHMTWQTSRDLFAKYESWHADLCGPNGKVDLSRIPNLPQPGDSPRGRIRPRPAEFEEWDEWGAKAAAANAPVFAHLLDGPAHPNPAKRPTMKEEVHNLTEFLTSAEQGQFDVLVENLREQASYTLQPKSSSDSSISSARTSYPLSVIQEDLAAFAAALTGEEPAPK